MGKLLLEFNTDKIILITSMNLNTKENKFIKPVQKYFMKIICKKIKTKIKRKIKKMPKAQSIEVVISNKTFENN